MRRIQTNSAPVPRGPYSQGLIANGPFLFVASQGPIDPATNEFVQGPIEVQAARVLENIKAIVEAAGASLAQVVKVTAFLSNNDDFDAFNRVYRTFFSEPYPPRTTVQSSLPGFLISVDVIVALEDN